MKATSKGTFGQGWHKQSLRHSNARKTGTAGGTYAVSYKDPLGKSFSLGTFPTEKKAYEAKLKYVKTHEGFTEDDDFWKEEKLKDTDGDGVPDKYDCQPKNPNKQDQNPLAVPFNKEKLTEKEVHLLLRRINSKKIDENKDLPRLNDGDGWELTEEQVEKGRVWLNKHRKDMTLREQSAMDTFKTITLVNFYSDRGDYRYPVYLVMGDRGNFEYVFASGEFKIIG